MTRTPPAAPPTTASVDEGLMPRDVIPSRLKRASSGVSLNMGVGDLGSQNMRMPSAHADIILLPVFFFLVSDGYMCIYSKG
jgi:hypothetical protein